MINQVRNSEELTEKENEEVGIKIEDENPSPKQDESPGIEPPRDFQLEIFEKSLRGNIILCAPTGIGKTRVAVMLIEKLAKEKPNKKIFFLVNKVILVHQQAKYIKKFLEKVQISVGKLYGEMGVDFWSEKKWVKALERHSVFVATAQILVNCLTTSFVKIGDIGLLVLDECHHCIKNDPYNRIMQEFYHPAKRNPSIVIPKIFGMTASPWTFSIKKLNAGFRENRMKCESVQGNMDSKVEIVNAERAVEYYARPNLKMISYYPHIPPSYHSIKSELKKYRGFYDRLESCEDGTQFPHINQFLLDLDYLLMSLGRWAFMVYLKESEEDNRLTFQDDFLSGLTREEKIFRRRVISHFTKDYDFKSAEEEIYKALGRERSFSPEDAKKKSVEYKTHEVTHKVQKLSEILHDYSRKLSVEGEKKTLFCGIIFVERRIASKVLTDLLRILKIRSVRVQCLFGHGSRKKNTNMRSREQEQIMRNFGSNNLYNLLVSTNVAEEGIDIQACNVVVRFDIFPDLRSFMQSRGRARKKESDYVIMYDIADPTQASLCKRIQVCEARMIETCEVGVGQGVIKKLPDNDQDTLVIKETGAKVSLSGSVSLINNLCSLLPGDAFFKPQPVFTIFSYSFGFMAEMQLPSNSPIKKKIAGRAQPNKKMAKASAALEGLKELHRIGYLSNKLIPKEKLKEKTRREAYGTSRIPKEMKIPPSKSFSEDFITQITKPGKEGFKPKKMYFYFFVHQHKPGENDYRFGLCTSAKFCASCISPFGCYYQPFEYDEYKVQRGETKPLSRKEMAYLKMFHHYIFSNLLDLGRIKVRGRPILRNYFIVPILSEKIDWDLIVRTYSSSKKFHSLDKFMKARSKMGKKVTLLELQEMTLRTTYNIRYSHHHNIYEVLSFSNKTPESKIESEKFDTFYEYYNKKHHLEDIDRSQNMLIARNIERKYYNITRKDRPFGKSEAIFLLPQYCEILPFDRRTFDAALKVWFFMQYLEISVRIVEFCEIFYEEEEIDEMTFRCMKEAFTLPSVDMYYNYERLEFLGDCLLKWIAAESYFFSEPNHHEGLLHDERTLVICNNNLYDLLNDTGTIKYHILFESVKDAPRFYRPPGYGKSKSVKLSSKQVADICESIIGAFYLAKGLDGVYTFLHWVKFQSLEEEYRYHKPLVTQHHIQLYMLYKLEEVEEKIGYKFRNKALLIESLTHPSFQLLECYQRLEYLGDAVIDFITTQHIFAHEKYKNLRNAGKLSLIRSVYVKNSAFSVYIIRDKIYNYLIHNNARLKRLIKGFQSGEKTINDVPKLFGDIFESLAGAVYIDSDYSVDTVREIFLDKIFMYKVPKDVQDSVLKEPLDYILRKYLRDRERELLKNRYGEGENVINDNDDNIEDIDKEEEEKLEKRLNVLVDRIKLENEVELERQIEEEKKRINNPEIVHDESEDELDEEEERNLEARLLSMIGKAKEESGVTGVDEGEKESDDSDEFKEDLASLEERFQRKVKIYSSIEDENV